MEESKKKLKNEINLLDREPLENLELKKKSFNFMEGSEKKRDDLREKSEEMRKSILSLYNKSQKKYNEIKLKYNFGKKNE